MCYLRPGCTVAEVSPSCPLPFQRAFSWERLCPCHTVELFGMPVGGFDCICGERGCHHGFWGLVTRKVTGVLLASKVSSLPEGEERTGFKGGILWAVLGPHRCPFGMWHLLSSPFCPGFIRSQGDWGQAAQWTTYLSHLQLYINWECVIGT